MLTRWQTDGLKEWTDLGGSVSRVADAKSLGANRLLAIVV